MARTDDERRRTLMSCQVTSDAWTMANISLGQLQALTELLQDSVWTSARVRRGILGLPDNYVHVELGPRFYEVGIDPEGRVSS